MAAFAEIKKGFAHVHHADRGPKFFN
jgi:hypothetical protein